jgi:hypothetical protein
MTDKHTEVVISIKKLVSLGVSNEEIVNNLSEVGLGKEEALKLIEEAKGGSTEGKSSKEIFDETTSKLSLGEQITGQLGLEKDLAKSVPKPVETKPVEKEVSKSIPQNTGNAKEEFGLKIKSNKQVDDKKPLIEKAVSVTPKPISNPIPKTFPSSVPVPKPIEEKPVEKEIPKNIVPEIKPVTKYSDNELFKLADEAKNNIRGVENKDKPHPLPNPIPQQVHTQAPMPKPVPQVVPKPIGNTQNIEELWKKGIVVAVNTKLDEMRRLKDEVDVKIAQNVDTAVKKETRQLKVLMESQKDLIISSNKQALEQKQKEISIIIDGKINEIKAQSKGLTAQIESMAAAKQGQQQNLDEVKQVLDEAKKTKSQLLIEMNSELVKSQSKAQEFIDKADEQLKSMDARIDKTLTLEKNIAEGLIDEAEQKIERLTITKADELIEELQIEVNTLKTIEKNINLEGIEQKVKMLDEFKREFVDSIEFNLEKINHAVEEINRKNKLVQKEWDEKVLTINAKMEELTKFEKKFIETMGKVVDKTKKKK